MINLFIPTDIGPTPGDGAYASGNILTDLTRLYSGADQPGDRVTPLEFTHNLVDPSLPDDSVSPDRPGVTIFDLGPGNVSALPGFLAPDSGDFRLAQGSPAIGTGPLGQDFGALTPAGIWISGEPPALTTSTSATLTVGAPGIFGYRWRLDGGPWSPDTDIGTGFDPGSGTVRTATIQLDGLADGPHTVEVEARNFAGAWQDSPTVSKTWTVANALPGTVLINEIDANGAPDSVEFFNPGTTPYDLAGHHLTDNPDTPTKITFPAATVVPAGGVLHLPIDPLAFALGARGESLTLFAPDATTVVDAVAFGHQPPGFTIGRTGHDRAWTLCQPTPGAPNLPQPTASPGALFISEWLAGGDTTFTGDFVEIFNPLPLPVDLSGLVLTDNPNSQPDLYQIPPLSFIGPGAAAAFDDDLNFNLSSTTEQLGLLTAAGSVIDAVVYTSQPADVTTTRDATGNTATGRLPTPGLVPGATDPAYLNALALFADLRITEVMYDPAQGTDFEFIELRNTGGENLDLTGVRLRDAVDFTFPAATLAPDEYVVVVKSAASFQSLYGAGLPVAGEYTGKLSNGGDTVVLLLPEPFDAAVHRFTYDDAWYPSTDGAGKSLVFSDPSLPQHLWGLESLWQPSAEDGGNPAGTTVVATGFPAWLVANGVTGADKDTDLDGLPHLLEYALGLDPLAPDPPSFAVAVVAGGNPSFSFPYPAAPRTDVTVVVEASPSLDAPTWNAIATRVGDGPWTGTATVTGTTTVTVTDTTATPPADSHVFYRIRASLIP